MRTETGPTLLSYTLWRISPTPLPRRSHSLGTLLLPFVIVFFASCWHLYFQQAPLFFPTTFVTYCSFKRIQSVFRVAICRKRECCGYSNVPTRTFNFTSAKKGIARS